MMYTEQARRRSSAFANGMTISSSGLLSGSMPISQPSDAADPTASFFFRLPLIHHFTPPIPSNAHARRAVWSSGSAFTLRSSQRALASLSEDVWIASV